MASVGNVAWESTTGNHCRTCTCASHDVSRTTYDLDIASCGAGDDDISRLEEEIARISDVLIVLKRRRNARLPVTRVPAELLSEIFIYFRDISIPPTATYWKTVPWISISHVCIRWRSVALGDARLWDTINLRFPDLVRDVSTRFASMPFRVVLSSPKAPDAWDDDAEYNHDHALGAILETNKPICSLEMNAPRHETKHVLQDLLPRAADSLLYLAIGLRPTMNELEILQNTRLPTLQTLSLEYVSFKLSSSVLASCAGSLRELKLNECMISEPSAKPLESLTRLEQLWLSGRFFFGLSPFPSAVEEINLPSVTKLYMKDNTVTMYNILQLFNCAQSCDITVCVVASEIQEWAALVIYVSSAHPKDAIIYIADGFIELRCAGKNAHYTLRCIYDEAVEHPDELGDIFHHKTTSLSVICNPCVALSPSDLWKFSETVRRMSSLTVCGHPLVVSLGTCLSEDSKFLPNLSLLHVCDCCADLGGQLSQTVHLRKDLEVRIGGVRLCCTLS